MTAKPNILVFDTNAIVSAILFRNSVPRRALELALKERQIISSAETRSELREVIRRPKFDRVAPLVDRQRAVEIVLDAMHLVRVTASVRVCRDAADDKLLELAISGHADVLVTGDADLLILNPFRGIQIMTPAGFLAL